MLNVLGKLGQNHSGLASLVSTAIQYSLSEYSTSVLSTWMENLLHAGVYLCLYLRYFNYLGIQIQLTVGRYLCKFCFTICEVNITGVLEL